MKARRALGFFEIAVVVPLTPLCISWDPTQLRHHP